MQLYYIDYIDYIWPQLFKLLYTPLLNTGVTLAIRNKSGTNYCRKKGDMEYNFKRCKYNMFYSS